MEVMPMSTGGIGTGAGLGGAVGGLLGSWLGNGGIGVGGRGGVVADTAVLDSLNGISGSINNMNTAMLQGQANANTVACQGFSGVISAINQGDSQIQSAMCQGFGGLNSSILTTALQGQNLDLQNTMSINNSLGQGFNSLSREISDCCCTTNANISAEANATRQLMSNFRMQDLEVALCDSKAKVGSLEAQQFTSAQIGASEVRMDNKLNNIQNTIINHVQAIC